MIKRLEPCIAAYVAGLIDGIAGQIGVTFRWDEQLSTVVIRGHPQILKWLTAATGMPATIPTDVMESGGPFWSVDGADLLELLKQIRPFAIRKASDFDQMIAWLQSHPAPTPGIMPI